MRRVIGRPKEPLLLGIDLGTSRLKVVLADPTGQVIGAAQAGYPTSRSREGIAEQDTDEWLGALRGTLAHLRRAIGPVALDGIAAIGVTGQMHGLVAVDSNGRPVRPCMTWEDARATAELAGVRRRISAERVCLLSGSPLSAGFAAGLARWLALREPESARRSQWFLQPKDWIRFMLTGEVATEPSDASGTLLLDVAASKWSVELLDAFEVEPRLLPPIIPSASVAGLLRPDVARELGLPPRLPVIAGGGDAPTTALGVGISASRGGRLGVLSFGTAAQIAVAADRPISHRLCSYQLFRHVIDGEWLMVAAIPSAGSSIAWLAQVLLPDHDLESGIRQLVAEAGLVLPGARGVVFLPQLLGRRSPRPEPAASGAFVGLRLQHGRPELARAALEGVGFALRDGLTTLRSQGFGPNALAMVGGAGDPDVWPQILSAILDIQIERSSDVAGAALGAAALAAEGAEIAPAISLIRPVDGAIIERSQADVSAYDAIYKSQWANAVGAHG